MFFCVSILVLINDGGIGHNGWYPGVQNRSPAGELIPLHARVCSLIALRSRENGVRSGGFVDEPRFSTILCSSVREPLSPMKRHFGTLIESATER